MELGGAISNFPTAPTATVAGNLAGQLTGPPSLPAEQTQSAPFCEAREIESERHLKN
jgi:hypothetical protein